MDWDLLSKDQKQRVYMFNSYKYTIILLLFLPIYLSILLPSALVCVAYFVLSKLLIPQNKKQIILPVLDQIKPRDQRQYDLIFFGVTGFTGYLGAQYIAKNYPDLNWAIAGRSQRSLQKIQSNLAQFTKRKIPIIIADSHNVEQIGELVKQTRAVISTVGPYSLYGEILVGMCAGNGVNYFDITGEFQFMSEMIKKYGDLARKSGSKIVEFCGFDSLPWDSLTFLAHQHMKKNNDSLQKIHHLNEFLFNPSGGTLYSVMASLDDPPLDKKLFSYLYQSLDGEKIKTNFQVKPTFQVLPKAIPFLKNQVQGFSITQGGNLPLIQRSNALLEYNKKLIYQETQVFQNYLQWLNQNLVVIYFITVICIYPLRKLLTFLGILFQPGQGPSQKFASQAYLNIYSIAEGEKGTLFHQNIYFNDEPGYHDTAKMLVESALTVIQNPEKYDKIQGGFYTTASLMGSEVIDRMVANGTVQYNSKIVRKNFD